MEKLFIYARKSFIIIFFLIIPIFIGSCGNNSNNYNETRASNTETGLSYRSSGSDEYNSSLLEQSEDRSSDFAPIFQNVTKNDIASNAELEAVFSRYSTASSFVKFDINSDNRPELIWLVDDSDRLLPRVVAVFEDYGNEKDLLFFDPEKREDDYYSLGKRALIYIRKNDWYITEFHCSEVLFDKDMNRYAGRCASIYTVDDEREYNSNVDETVRKSLSFIRGKGVIYQKLAVGENALSGDIVSYDEWSALLKSIAGKDLKAIDIEMEAKRHGCPGNTEVNVDTAGGVSILYPSVKGDYEKAEDINLGLKNSAYSLLRIKTAPEDTFADGKGDDEDDRKPGEYERSNVDYRILSSEKDRLSVVYREYERADGGSSKYSGNINFYTVDISSGKELKISDVTGLENIANALNDKKAELFLLNESGKFEKSDKSLDSEYIKKAVDSTASILDKSTGIGLDEQYLYLAVVLPEGSGSKAVVRLPRWEIDANSEGHMELLYAHPVFPYINEVLSFASELSVRSVKNGIDFSYINENGEFVKANLHELETARRTDRDANAAKQVYAESNAKVSGFSVGLLELDSALKLKSDRNDGRDEKAETDPVTNYFAVEEGTASRGYIYISADDKWYEISYEGSRGSSGLILSRNVEGSGLKYRHMGDFKSFVRYKVWRNTENNSCELSYVYNKNLRYEYEFKESDYGLEIFFYPNGDRNNLQNYSLGSKDASFEFTDVNNDGYEDIIFGGGACFIYSPFYKKYIELYKELSGDTAYVFDHNAENEAPCVLVDRSKDENLREYIKYRIEEDGSLIRLSELNMNISDEGIAVISKSGEDEIIFEADLTGQSSYREAYRIALILSDEILSKTELQIGGEEEKYEFILGRSIEYKDVAPYETLRLYVADEDKKLIGFYEIEPASHVVSVREQILEPMFNASLNKSLLIGNDEVPEPVKEEGSCLILNLEDETQFKIVLTESVIEPEE